MPRESPCPWSWLLVHVEVTINKLHLSLEVQVQFKFYLLIINVHKMLPWQRILTVFILDRVDPINLVEVFVWIRCSSINDKQLDGQEHINYQCPNIKRTSLGIKMNYHCRNWLTKYKNTFEARNNGRVVCTENIDIAVCCCYSLYATVYIFLNSRYYSHL